MAQVAVTTQPTDEPSDGRMVVTFLMSALESMVRRCGSADCY
uniref:GTF2I repeat domain containing 2 n=1 Tax=Mus musculus TaxID=10090 RepID=D6RI26_MOUSE